MSAQADAVVTIGAKPNLAPGLAEAKGELDGWARGAAAGVNGATGATVTSLSKFKEGISRSREAAMFFTASLGEFGPAGRTAQFALSGIAGALMGGGGVIFAMEAVRVAIRLVTAGWEENAEAIKTAKAEAVATADAYLALADVISRTRFAGMGESREKSIAMSRNAAERERLKILREQHEVEDKIAQLVKDKVPYDRQRVVRDQLEALQQQFLATVELQKAEEANINREYDERAVKAAEDRFNRQNQMVGELDAHVRAYYAYIAAEEEKLAAQERDRALYADVGFAELEAPAFGEAVVVAKDEIKQYNAEVKKSREEMRQWVALGVSTFFDLARAAGSGADAIRAVWDNLLNAFLSMLQQMVTEWITAQMVMSAATAAGGATGGGLGAGVPGVELLPMPPIPGVKGKVSPLSATSGGTEVNVYVNALDAASFDDYLAKNEGVLASRISRLSYKGRID